MNSNYIHGADPGQVYTVIDINSDGLLSLMAENADTREDLRLPASELGDKIREEFEKGAGQVHVSIDANALFKVQNLTLNG